MIRDIILVATLAALGALCAAVSAWSASPEDYLSYAIPKSAVERNSPVRPGLPYATAKVYLVGDEIVGERAYAADGSLFTETAYRNGEKHGIQRMWHPNGKLRSESPFRDGVMHGLFKQWDAHGRLLGSYLMSQGTGTARTWFDDGRLKSECHNGDGRKHGLCREWHPNGQLASEARFLGGEEDGLTMTYYASGKPSQRLQYRHGKAHEIAMMWDQKGNLVEQSPRFYVNGHRVDRGAYGAAARADPSLPGLDTVLDAARQ